jgi:hypothetical protein
MCTVLAAATSGRDKLDHHADGHHATSTSPEV